MGTSTRNINNKIANLLKEYYQNEVRTDIIIPKSALKIIPYEKYFNSHTEKYLDGAKSIAKKIEANGYSFLEIAEEDVLDDKKVTEILVKITNELNFNRNYSHEKSSIFIDAFKIAFSANILERNESAQIFLKNYCSEIVKLMLNENFYEPLVELRNDLSENEIEEEIEKITKEKIDGRIKAEVNSYLKNEIDMEELFEILKDKLTR